MSKIEVIAKKDFYPLFKKGDKLAIVPILYEENTILVPKMFRIFKNKHHFTLCVESELILYPISEGFKLEGFSSEVIAKKGSWKDSYIELEDGSQYPSCHFRSYKDFFEKI